MEVVVRDNTSIFDIIINIVSIVVPSAIAIFTVFYESRQASKRDKIDKSSEVKRNFILKLLEEYTVLLHIFQEGTHAKILCLQSDTTIEATQRLTDVGSIQLKLMNQYDYICMYHNNITDIIKIDIDFNKQRNLLYDSIKLINDKLVEIDDILLLPTEKRKDEKQKLEDEVLSMNKVVGTYIINNDMKTIADELNKYI